MIILNSFTLSVVSTIEIYVKIENVILIDFYDNKRNMHRVELSKRATIIRQLTILIVIDFYYGFKTSLPLSN